MREKEKFLEYLSKGIHKKFSDAESWGIGDNLIGEALHYEKWIGYEGDIREGLIERLGGRGKIKTFSFYIKREWTDDKEFIEKLESILEKSEAKIVDKEEDDEYIDYIVKVPLEKFPAIDYLTDIVNVIKDGLIYYGKRVGEDGENILEEATWSDFSVAVGGDIVIVNNKFSGGLFSASEGVAIVGDYEELAYYLKDIFRIIGENFFLFDKECAFKLLPDKIEELENKGYDAEKLSKLSVVGINTLIYEDLIRQNSYRRFPFLELEKRLDYVKEYIEKKPFKGVRR